MNMEQRIRAAAIMAVASTGEYVNWDRNGRFWEEVDVAERYILSGEKPDISPRASVQIL